MTNEESKARELIVAVYEKRKDVGYVSPSWLATEVMQMLDPDRSSHQIEYAMAHLQFRQLARGVCAGKWEDPDDPREGDQHDLFPVLQRRYPIARSSGKEEPQYALLELLTDRDIHFNIERLRNEAMAKLKHADALEAWAASRQVRA
jgi:hypothetical protein